VTGQFATAMSTMNGSTPPSQGVVNLLSQLDGIDDSFARRALERFEGSSRGLSETWAPTFVRFLLNKPEIKGIVGNALSVLELKKNDSARESSCEALV
jgi:hypothetical protein